MDETDKENYSLEGVFRRLQRRYQLEPLASWTTLLAAFMLNITVPAPNAFAIFYDYFVEKYDTTRSNVGWVMSAYVACGCLSNIITSPMLTIYGGRPVAVAISTILALGMSLSAIAPSLVWLIILYGAMGGIGVFGTSLCTMTAVQQVFSQNRGLATGMSCFGFTAGTTLCPMIVEYLLRQYTLEGALLLYSTLFVQAILFATLLNSPKNNIVPEDQKAPVVEIDDDAQQKGHIRLLHETGHVTKRRKIEEGENAPLVNELGYLMKRGLLHELDEPNASGSPPQYYDSSLQSVRKSHLPDGRLTNHNYNCELDQPVQVNSVEHNVYDSQEEKSSWVEGELSNITVNTSNHKLNGSFRPNSSKYDEENMKTSDHSAGNNTNHELDEPIESNPIQLNHIDSQVKRYSQSSTESDNSKKGISKHESGKAAEDDPMNGDSFAENETKCFSRNNPNHDLHEQVIFNTMKDKQETLLNEPDTTSKKDTFKRILYNMKDFSLMTQRPYLLSLAYFTLYYSCALSITAHTVGGALHIGLGERESAYLMTIMGLSNFVFRIISTVIMNFSWFNPLWYTALGSFLLTCSASVAACADDYALFVVAVIFMGAVEGINNTVESLVIVKVVGVPNVAKAFTSTGIFSMPVMMGVVPFGGWLVDVTGAYTMLFTVVGAVSAVSVLLILAADLLLRRKRHQEEEANRGDQPIYCDTTGQTPTLMETI